MTAGFRIVDGDSPARLELARALVREYGAIPVIAAHWPEGEVEAAALPADYVPPRGALLLALAGEAPLGCVALRPLAPGVGELKRLYVRESARGRGVGEALVRAVMARARAAGDGLLRLDTIPSLAAARALYARLGFREIPQYRGGLYAGAVCYEIALGAPPPA